MSRFRSEPRFDCDFDVKVTLHGRSATCTVTNISRRGLSAEQCPILRIQTGDRVNIVSDKLGCASGTVRWAGMNDIGVELEKSLEEPVFQAIVAGRKPID